MMRRIKILQVVGSSNIGGAEKAFCSLIRYLDKERFEIYIVCPSNGPMLKEYTKYAKEVKVFNFNNWLTRLYGVFYLKRYIKLKKIDVVHTHLFSADFMGLIAARFAGVCSKIATIQGYNFSFTGRFDLRTIKNFFCSLAYRMVYRFSDKIIAVSEALKEDLEQRSGIKVCGENIEVIYNAIDQDALSHVAGIGDLRLKYAQENGVKLVGVIANFDRIKGHRTLLKAIPAVLAKERDARFIFVGDGEDKRYLERMTKKLKIEDKVIFTGTVRDARSIISACDLVVLPSLFEGLPLVLMEAMLSSKPVVASKVGGIQELVKEGESGLLVPPKDHKRLCEAIANVLRDKELAIAMGARGKAIVSGGAENRFNTRYMTKKIQNLYEGLLCLHVE